MSEKVTWCLFLVKLVRNMLFVSIVDSWIVNQLCVFISIVHSTDQVLFNFLYFSQLSKIPIKLLIWHFVFICWSNKLILITIVNLLFYNFFLLIWIIDLLLYRLDNIVEVLLLARRYRLILFHLPKTELRKAFYIIWWVLYFCIFLNNYCFLAVLGQ